jgi:hypothetical protein
MAPGSAALTEFHAGRSQGANTFEADSSAVKTRCHCYSYRGGNVAAGFPARFAWRIARLPCETLAYVILSQAHVIHSNAYCHPGDGRDPGFRGTVVARFAGSGNVINSKSLPHADGATAVHVDRRIYPL